MTSKICWLAVRSLSSALPSRDRDAALGDLIESRERPLRALLDVLGLVARRRWPWVALIFVGVLLRIASSNTTDVNSVTLWFYTNNWDWALLRDIAFRQNIAQNATEVSLSFLFLACCSWIAGVISRRAASPAIALTLVAAAVFIDPLPHEYAPVDAVVFDGTFYRILFPILVKTLLVLLPFRFGMLKQPTS